MTHSTARTTSGWTRSGSFATRSSAGRRWAGGALAVLIAASGLTLAIGAAGASTISSPVLHAKSFPAGRYIVQGASSTAVRTAGGKVEMPLPIVHGVVAQLNASAADTLGNAKGVVLTIDASLKLQGGGYGRGSNPEGTRRDPGGTPSPRLPPLLAGAPRTAPSPARTASTLPTTDPARRSLSSTLALMHRSPTSATGSSVASTFRGAMARLRRLRPWHLRRGIHRLQRCFFGRAYVGEAPGAISFRSRSPTSQGNTAKASHRGHRLGRAPPVWPERYQRHQPLARRDADDSRCARPPRPGSRVRVGPGNRRCRVGRKLRPG